MRDIDEDIGTTLRPSSHGRRRNPDESRRRILDAGERAFAVAGFGGARLREIAHEAGVHHALVHHYFGDKQGLFQAVVNRGIERILLAGQKALAEPASLEGAVSDFVGVLFDFCTNNRHLMRISEDALRNHELASCKVTRDALAVLGGPLVMLVRQRIVMGQELGLVRRDVTAESLILFGFGAITFAADTAETVLGAMGLPIPRDEGLAQRREHVIAYVLGALRPIPAEDR